MGIKSSVFLKLLLLSIFIITSIHFINSDETQDTDISNEIIDNTEDSQFIFKYNENNEPVFIQKLFWEKSPYDFKYRFIMKDAEGEIILDKEMKRNFIECSLRAGEYSYKVITFNIFEQPEFETEWLSLSIIKTYVPVIDNVSVETIFIENFYNDPIVITGNDFTDEVTVHLKDLNNPLRKPVYGNITEKSNGKLVTQFKKSDFEKSTYDLVVSNPGKVYASRKVTVKYQKPVDIFSTTGWAPAINAGSGDFNEIFSDTNVFFPGGVQVELTIFPLKYIYGFVGFGLIFDYNYFEEIKNVSLYGFFMKWVPTVSYFYWFNKYVGISPRFGVGLCLTGFLFDYGNVNINKSLTSLDPLIMFGVGVEIRPWRGTSVFFGVDYSQIFYKDSSAGFIEPFISTGYYF